MRIKCYYRRSMKMSATKLATQVGHTIANLTRNIVPTDILVTEVGDDMFRDLKKTPRCFVQEDTGTELVLGFWEHE